MAKMMAAISQTRKMGALHRSAIQIRIDRCFWRSLVPGVSYDWISNQYHAGIKAISPELRSESDDTRGKQILY